MTFPVLKQDKIPTWMRSKFDLVHETDDGSILDVSGGVIRSISIVGLKYSDSSLSPNR